VFSWLIAHLNQVFILQVKVLGRTCRVHFDTIEYKSQI
jgi:hypothetical protein